MKILVTGAGGLLGREVWRTLKKDHTLSAIGRTQPPQVSSEQWRLCDLTDEDLVYRLITRENPDLIVHTAAFNDVDGAERRPEDAYRGNALVCRNLALACQRFDATLMSVSSDYVFDGTEAPEQGYREFDRCRPLSRYGESKLWGERFIASLLAKYFIIRTSWLFGPTRATWVDKVALAAREGTEIPAVIDMVSSPTYTPDLADAMAILATTHRFGVYHLTNSGFCNRVELAEEVGRLHRRAGAVKIKKLTQDQLGLAARRPVFSALDNVVWRLDGRASLRPWENALADHFERASVLK